MNHPTVYGLINYGRRARHGLYSLINRVTTLGTKYLYSFQPRSRNEPGKPRVGKCSGMFTNKNFGKFPLVSMGGRAKGLACADLEARTPIGASGIKDTLGLPSALQ